MLHGVILSMALKVSRFCTVSLLVYLIVLKIISPGSRVWASLMLFLHVWQDIKCSFK